MKKIKYWFKKFIGLLIEKKSCKNCAMRNTCPAFKEFCSSRKTFKGRICSECEFSVAFKGSSNPYGHLSCDRAFQNKMKVCKYYNKY